MGKTAAELRQEIEQTRLQMSRTVDQLNERVNETRRKLSLSAHVRERPLAIAAGVATAALLLGMLRGIRH